ncbi:MAG: pilin [Candidatus Shapirobacteria bacterium]
MSLVNQVLAAPDDKTIDLNAPNQFDKLDQVNVSNLVKGVINFLLIGAGLIFFVMLVLGGIKWIMSEGDETKVKTAQGQVQNALVGLVVVFSAWAILRLIQAVFGIDLLETLTFPTVF